MSTYKHSCLSRQMVCCFLFYFSVCAVEMWTCSHVCGYLCVCMCVICRPEVTSDVFLSSSLLYALDPELRDWLVQSSCLWDLVFTSKSGDIPAGIYVVGARHPNPTEQPSNWTISPLLLKLIHCHHQIILGGSGNWTYGLMGWYFAPELYPQSIYIL